MPEQPTGPAWFAELEEEHARLSRHTLLRQRRVMGSVTGPVVEVAGRCLTAFLSNDYLGLAAEPQLREAVADGARQWGAGSGSSPLVAGHLACHERAEQALAEFVGMEQALLFITGYMANLAVLTSLMDDEDDVIFSDALNHASLIDGCRLAKAKTVRYPHRDLAALEQALAAHSGRRRMIVTDAVFSMDGDEADLPGLLRLAEQQDALLLVDDAHGFGVLGPEGRGSVTAAGLRSARLVLMGTLGKAAGLSGAFVAADARVIRHLVQRARTYIYSTSPAPALATAVPTALAMIAAGDGRRAQLQWLAAELGRQSSAWRVLPTLGRTPIVPVVLGDAGATMALAQQMAAHGVLVAGIRPPTVPQGSSRLRISLSAAHTGQHLQQLLVAAQRAGLAR